ncbi:MAG TPA: hypothetical protein VGF50_11750 [Caulobacteraceae bacterium]|jgi:hypothetical protein
MSGKSLHDELVWDLVDRLQRESDPVRKHALRTLLLEQEDRFGSVTEKLDRADAHIAAGHFKISELERATASLKARGADVALAQNILRNLREILATFGDYRELVRQQLDRHAF